MKITMIHGQNHKGTTYTIGKKLALSLAKQEEITEFFLPKDMPHFCIGCGNCLIKGAETCPHFGAVEPVCKAIDQAELLILTSPVYVYHCTGSMKALLDHFAYRWMVHRPNGDMVRKQAVVVATAAGAGMKSTIKDMQDSLSFWGVGKVYTCGMAVRSMSPDTLSPKVRSKIDRQVAAIAKAVNRNRGKTFVPFKTRFWYTALAMVNRKKGLSQIDQDYWVKQGWTAGQRPWKKP